MAFSIDYSTELMNGNPQVLQDFEISFAQSILK